MANRLRLGIVGLGAQESAYAQMISDATVPRVAIGAICDGSAARRKVAESRYPPSHSRRLPGNAEQRVWEAGELALSTRVLGRWLGWWAIVAGVGLILVRFAWSGEIWYAPYALFWLWMIIICIQLIRRKIALPEAAEGA